MCLFALVSGFAIGCEAPSELVITRQSSWLAPDPATSPAVPQIPLPMGVGTSPAVCGPFGGGTVADQAHGLIADLLYLPSNPTVPRNMALFRTFGIPANVSIFLPGVDVPTREFSSGFPLAGGGTLVDNGGVSLIENFYLHMFSVLKVNTAAQEGSYQFATLSDDGSVLQSLVDPSNPVILVNSDGDHATQLRVAQEPVTLRLGDSLPISLEYFQGPRYEIAMILLWRKLPAGATMVSPEPLDGSSGGFFDPTTSAPEGKYTSLLADGWVPVPAENYYLPNSIHNPCNTSGPAGATAPTGTTAPTGI